MADYMSLWGPGAIVDGGSYPDNPDYPYAAAPQQYPQSPMQYPQSPMPNGGTVNLNVGGPSPQQPPQHVGAQGQAGQAVRGVAWDYNGEAYTPPLSSPVPPTPPPRSPASQLRTPKRLMGPHTRAQLTDVALVMSMIANVLLVTFSAMTAARVSRRP